MVLATPSFAAVNYVWNGVTSPYNLDDATNWLPSAMPTDYDRGFITSGPNWPILNDTFPAPPDSSWVNIGDFFVGEGLAGKDGATYTPGAGSLTIGSSGRMGVWDMWQADNIQDGSTSTFNFSGYLQMHDFHTLNADNSGVALNGSAVINMTGGQITNTNDGNRVWSINLGQSVVGTTAANRTTLNMSNASELNVAVLWTNRTDITLSGGSFLNNNFAQYNVVGGDGMNTTTVNDSSHIDGQELNLGYSNTNKGTSTSILYLSGATAALNFGNGNARIWVGRSDAGEAITSGAIWQSGANSTATANDIELGRGNSGTYGYWNLSAGSVTDLTTGDGIQLGQGGSTIGIFDQSGGTVFCNTGAEIGSGGASTVGMYTIENGSATFNGWTVNLGLNDYGKGIVSVGTGGQFTSAGTVTVGAYTYVGTGIVNVGTTHNAGGILTVPNINANYNAIGSLGIVNFHGGTLQASADTGDGTNTYGPNDGLLMNTKNYVYSEGATIDSQNYAVAISSPLLAPAGKGVTAISVAGLTTTGYIGRAYVEIDDPTGQGAVAQAVVNPATGAVTGIDILNPGTGYTSPTIKLVGGGGSYTGTFAAPTLATAASGDFTKVGTGSLSLNGNNTYQGATTVSDGTLVLAGNNTYQARPMSTQAPCCCSARTPRQRTPRLPPEQRWPSALAVRWRRGM